MIGRETLLTFLRTTPRKWKLTPLHQDGVDYYLILYRGDLRDVEWGLEQLTNDGRANEFYWAMYDGIPRPGMMRHPFDEQLRIDIINAVGLGV